MGKAESVGVIAREMGLAGALAWLAACGPGGPGESSTQDEADADAQGEEGEEGEEGEPQLPDVPPAVPTCTVENYESHEDVLDLLELICVAPGEDELCAPCDELCAYELSTCQDSCFNHTLLCQEVVEEQCCYLITASENTNSFVPGRPLREHDAPLLPPVHELEGSASPCGAGYRALARCERGSVQAFEHCAALLDVLGAPRGLVLRNRAAARQEQGHAQLALRAAEALDGCRAVLGDTPRPQQPLALRAFLRHLIADGCIGEAAAANEARWALAQPEVRTHPAVQEFWLTVAREEAGHAALAWSTLEFLLAQVPALASEVEAALREAMADAASLRPRPATLAERDAERFGLASPRTKAKVLRETLADLGRCAARVGDAQRGGELRA